MSVYRWMEEKRILRQNLGAQAQRYVKFLKSLGDGRLKGNLSSVVMWGIDDMDSWLVDHPIKRPGRCWFII